MEEEPKNNTNSGGLYKGLRMSEKVAGIIVFILATALAALIAIAIFKGA